MEGIIINIIALMTAFVGAQGFWQLIDHLIKKRKKNRSLLNGIEDLHEIYNKMSEIRELGGARIILFAGHNSGGVPRAHSPFYVSALHGTTSDNHKIRLTDYQNLQVDMEYIKMLLDSEREGYVELHADKMKQCILKDYYIAEGVLHSLVMFLGIVENKFLYMSVCKYEDVPFTETDITKIRLKAQQISGIINKNTEN